ncbi:carboxypeptidase regulatory-like domain-containing protein [Aquimarina sp. RZ0]|uniref:TonB-dependent receptor n=1 Tax=Aquimarina sp. RZ0 TaxID=2607730 RepID=UPI0011F1A0E9|nr:carboxypeptidase regulatory-like domain-containing protein [Aquimarina sp. RZ0]KAA1243664.1 TonB-dependent receptor [Aquimarina sp. RZ0]
MKKITFLFVIILIAIVGETFAQGVTTSSLGGKITDNLGKPLPGATVLAIHQPSGTNYGVTTDFDGYYRMSGMRTGGPYTVVISYVGFQEFKKENIFLQLGQSFRISHQMKESSTALEEVVITATNNGVFNSNKTGAETNISQREIQNLPQTSRSIADFVRITPQAQITEGDDGFSISLAGQNNRLNAIYIDGAINNDVFGLAGSGTNGGQTGVNPFSVDAVETFQVQIAPFDVRISGFAGGAISAVTRSGTNSVEGSVYSFLRNESLAGKTPPRRVDETIGEEREKLPEFTALTYGLRVGGPIIEDKLFYFINYEREDREVPQPFNISNYTGDTNTLAGIQDFASRTLATYGYDVGGFQNNTATLISDKVTFKLDWNINDSNKLSFRHSYVRGENLEARNSNTRSIGFLNGSEEFITTTNSSALEINSRIGDKFSNNFILGYTRVRDDRDPSGNPFPTVRIVDGLDTRRFDQGLIFGNEPFSTANLLEQDIFTLTNNFEIYKGRHTITLGTHNEFSKIKNLFFAFNNGNYTFLTVDDFLNGGPVDFYERRYSLSGGTGDESTGAAEFDVLQLGFYAQDEVQFSDNFKITAGLRFDVPFWDDGIVNDDFNNRTIPLLESAGYDLQGTRVGTGVDTRVLISPRVGFNWDVKGERSTQIRGGFGIFTSRLPLVWPAATYNNNGITEGRSRSFNFDDPIVFNPDVNNQPVHLQPGDLGGDINLFTPDFKLPQIFKSNIAVDQKIPFWGLVVSADLLWNENISTIQYQQLNIEQPIGTLQGADDRPFYSDDDIDRTYGDVILASNTGEGNSWNASLTLKKPFSRGFQGQVSYSYGESNSIFDGTSSRNISQWTGIETVNGKNRPELSRSDFAQGHRFTSNISYEYVWNNHLKSTIGLFYEGSQSQPFSFIYNGTLLGDNRSDNALIYVPRNRSEINLVDTDEFTADQQWDALDNFISNNSYLRDRRGQYAERNGARGPWSHIIDLRFAQDFSINFGNKKHSIQATIDINNFTNLLNKDWGQRKFIPGRVSLLTVEDSGSRANPDFSFNPDRFGNNEDLEDIVDTGRLNSSRWQIQVGLRYLFK